MRRAHLDPGYNNRPVGSGSHILEEENDKLTQGLSEKVRALKSLTIDIGHEVRDQNKYLREMDTDFDNSGGFLQRTMGRVKQLSRQGHNCWIMVYLTLFALAVFLVCWLILKFR